MKRTTSILVIATAVVLILVLQSCGSSGGGTTSSSTAEVAPTPAAKEAAGGGEHSRSEKSEGGKGEKKTPSQTGGPKAEEAKSTTGKRTAPFVTKGGDNSIQESGQEGNEAELKQAAATLHAFLQARADEKWSTACKNMAAGVTKSLQQMAAAAPKQLGKKKVTCQTVVAAMSAGMPASLQSELTKAKAGALRVNGKSAFLLFHGAHGTDYFMPMAKEGGEWKVAALAASALP